MKSDKLTYLTYISLHHIDQRIKHIDHQPHTQWIEAHQLTRIHRKKKYQLNGNQQANLIKVSNIQSKSIDSVIDLLEEGKETVFSFNEDNLPMAQFLQ